MKLKSLISLNDQLDENLLDDIKIKLGHYAGKIVKSVSSMLGLLKKNPNQILTTVEKFEVVGLGVKDSRVDTGAKVCSILAVDISIDQNLKTVKFIHDGKNLNLALVSVEKVKNANGEVERPFVELDYKWNGLVYKNIKTSLADRSKMKFKFLIGRNLIRELKLPVSINDIDD